MKSSDLSNLHLALMAWLLLAIAFATPSMARADAPQWEETLPALRIQVDAPRNRAWVLNRDAVYLYDVQAKKLVKKIELPDWSFVGEPFGRAPDLALAPSGAVFVTSNVLPTIWEIDAVSLAVRQHRLALDADDDKDVGFTALAVGRNGHDLFAVSSLLGSVWLLDLDAGQGYKLAPLQMRQSSPPVPMRSSR